MVAKSKNKNNINKKSTVKNKAKSKKVKSISNDKRYKNNKNKNERVGQEIAGVFFIAFGLILLLGLYFNASIGIVGDFIREVLLGLISLPAFFLPPILIIYGVFILFKREKPEHKTGLFYIFLFFIIISAIVHTGYYNNNIDAYKGMAFFRVIGQFYQEGTLLKGGGALGGILCLPFYSTFQMLGALIILFALSIVIIILFTNISVADSLSKVRNKVSAINERRQERREILREKKLESDLEEIRISQLSGKTPEFSKKSKEFNFVIDDDKNKKKAREGSQISIKNHSEERKKQILKKIHDKEETKEEKIEEQLERAPKNMNIEYVKPPSALLKSMVMKSGNSKKIKERLYDDARKLENTLMSFGVEAKVVNISRGPTVTRYELQPSPGVKVSRIVRLSDDIALNLTASSVRIEAPIPGKAAVGIEIPNKESESVLFKDIVESNEFEKSKSKLSFALGKNLAGENLVVDIAKMPHLLIAGATGSGKSVCINSLIMSVLYKASPEDVRLILIDPKMIELKQYNGIPHLLIPVVNDPKKAAGALNWAVQEMVNRYKKFADVGARDLAGYNRTIKQKDDLEKLPQIVIVIDELSDLMMAAPADVEDYICRLAQMARAAGMHLVIATQRPSVNVITGLIKANIPSRISFAVSSQIDSRTIIDMAGAEKLLGRGDMLYYPVGYPKPVRIQGTFVSDSEIEDVVSYLKNKIDVNYDQQVIDKIENDNPKNTKNNQSADCDEFLDSAIDMIIQTGQASVSFIQRKFKVGYARAARIIDQIEERGIVSGHEGSKPRNLLITKEEWQEIKMSKEKDK